MVAGGAPATLCDSYLGPRQCGHVTSWKCDIWRQLKDDRGVIEEWNCDEFNNVTLLFVVTFQFLFYLILSV